MHADRADLANLAARVQSLEALFDRIATTRMAGVPILHPRLAVRAVGFEAVDEGRAAIGVLVTPWFMNLVWLPLVEGGCATPVGTSRTRTVGHERLDFLGAHEDGFGPYESCSLFSPMQEFADQAAALATAEQVLAILRAPAAPDAQSPQTAPAVPPDSAAPPSKRPAAPRADRRALLFGRGAP